MGEQDGLTQLPAEQRRTLDGILRALVIDGIQLRGSTAARARTIDVLVDHARQEILATLRRERA